jgi:hypothetical protein
MRLPKLPALLAPLAVTIATVATSLIVGPGTVRGTPALNFSGETLSKVFFEEIRINTGRDHDHHDKKRPHGANRQGGKHHGDDDDDDAGAVKIKVTEPSDVYIVRNTVPPGGYSGWHTHPGPSVVSVTTGVATVYDGDDAYCLPARYPAGTGFIDAGGDHVHMVRNEGTTDLVTVAFQIIPTGTDRRIDRPAPGYCGF